MVVVSVTKAITLHPVYADAIAEGRKWIETRPSPPNGNMRPEGVRGLPGRAIDQYEMVAIHAGAPRFEIVATAVVEDVAFITDGEACPLVLPPYYSGVDINEWRALLHRFIIEPIAANSDWCSRDITDQLPLGNFWTGQWAWVLANVHPLTVPLPCKGRQGVWELPADIADRIGGAS